MNRKDCRTCGFVNFAQSSTCKKCGAELTSASPGPVSKVKFGVPTFSVNGFGVDLFDYQEIGSGRFKVMKWITAAAIPILPLSAWIIRAGTVSSEIPGMHNEYRFEVLEKTGLNFGRVLRILLLNVVSIAPLILMILYGFKLSERLTVNWYFELASVLFLAAVGWLFVLQVKFADTGHKHYAWQDK